MLGLKKYIIFVETNVVVTNKKTLLNRKLVVALMGSGSRVDVEMNQFFKTYDISLPQFNVLRILRGLGGKPANLSTISERMIHKKSNTTRLIDKLSEKQLVARKICEQNRRKIEVELTANGEQLLKKIDLHLDEKEAEMLGPLNQNEKEKLLALIQKTLTS